jgi:hypothetical protein
MILCSIACIPPSFKVVLISYELSFDGVPRDRRLVEGRLAWERVSIGVVLHIIVHF